MTERRLFLDVGVGEVRGVVMLDGRPERLLIRRDGDDPRTQLGARLVGRVRRVDVAISAAFVDIGDGLEAVLPFKPGDKPAEGCALELEVRSEPRRGKLAVVRRLGEALGGPRLLDPPPPLTEQLQEFARGVGIVDGPAARAAADDAEAQAVEVVHPLSGGGRIAIEPTRALTAVDIDLGERKGADTKRITRQANLAALTEGARLLRLKGLGGLVVFDLVGRGHDGAALLAAARLAFAADNPGVALGPISRFGTLELTIPRRAEPVLDRLLRPDGAFTARCLAQALIRRIEAEARADPGGRFVVRAAPEVAEEARPLAARLAEVIGARFAVESESGWPRERVEVAPA